MINTQSIIKFSSDVELLVERKKLTYLEAIMEYVETERLDIEIVPKLLSPYLLQKLEQESADLHLITKQKKLEMI